MFHFYSLEIFIELRLFLKFLRVFHKLTKVVVESASFLFPFNLMKSLIKYVFQMCFWEFLLV